MVEIIKIEASLVLLGSPRIRCYAEASKSTLKEYEYEDKQNI